MQMVFHHVLPLAMPGMMTGTIIGMARALGESAPLLMIGMVAFIVDIPGGFTDPGDRAAGSDLPVGGQPRARLCRTDLCGNHGFAGLSDHHERPAVLLRKRFEKRW
jgi:phosphate transport system permease protein